MVTAVLRCARAGVGLTFDDHGTVYPSPAFFRNAPKNRLMIDRGFASNLNSDGEDAAVVQAAIVRAKRFGSSLIAEGTSNEVPQSRLSEFIM